jgi:hypothetical protein
MQNQSLLAGPEQLEALRTLRSVDKFLPEVLYPGAPTEEIRHEAEKIINQLLDKLILGLPADPQKQFVMSQFKNALSDFEHADTEERERFCGYLEEIMDITGIQSSDGLLNNWLYGFDPNNP